MELSDLKVVQMFFFLAVSTATLIREMKTDSIAQFILSFLLFGKRVFLSDVKNQKKSFESGIGDVNEI